MIHEFYFYWHVVINVHVHVHVAQFTHWRLTELALTADCCTSSVHEKVTSKGKGARHQIESVQDLAEKMRSKLMEGREKIDTVRSTAARDLKV